MAISVNDSLKTLDRNLAKYYAVNRLFALNESTGGIFGGAVYKALQGKTIQLTVAGSRNLRRHRSGWTPALEPDGDTAYFYFFSKPVAATSLGAPRESIGGHPGWRASAYVMRSSAATLAELQQPPREVQTWLTLARPDLLVAGTGREIVIDVVAWIDAEQSAPRRALPEDLPGWAEVDWHAVSGKQLDHILDSQPFTLVELHAHTEPDLLTTARHAVLTLLGATDDQSGSPQAASIGTLQKTQSYPLRRIGWRF